MSYKVQRKRRKAWENEFKNMNEPFYTSTKGRRSRCRGGWRVTFNLLLCSLLPACLCLYVPSGFGRKLISSTVSCRISGNRTRADVWKLIDVHSWRKSGERDGERRVLKPYTCAVQYVFSRIKGIKPSIYIHKSGKIRIPPYYPSISINCVSGIGLCLRSVYAYRKVRDCMCELIRCHSVWSSFKPHQKGHLQSKV